MSDGTRTPSDEPGWVRRKRLAAVFGDSLPDTTSDERDPGEAAASSSEESASDRWLKQQVPPHHG